MKIVTVYTARNAAESALVAGMLREMEFDAAETEDTGAKGGLPVEFFYPVRVPEEQAAEARKALREQGLEPDEAE